MKKILIIAAHADDEVLGCGGTIYNHCKKGDEVNILILADGESARDLNKNKIENLIKLRKASAKKASKSLGVKNILFLGLRDNKLDSYNLIDIVKKIEKKIKLFSPEIVYTHYENDLNVDHRIAFKATLTACRPQSESSVKTILSYEVASSSEWNFTRPAFNPNWFVNISNSYKYKKNALNFYSSELKNSPHPRSLEYIHSLAKIRGACVGYDLAEGFILVRKS